MTAITGVVLAGGRSTRMGQEKAFLPYGGKKLIEHIVSRLQPYCDNILVSVNEASQYEFLKLPLITDKNKNCGPLGGLEAAIDASPTELCFIIPCDVPFISGAIIPLLASEIGTHDACVPLSGGFYEPLVALYNKTALTAFRECLKEKKYKVSDSFPQMMVRYIPEEMLRKRCLANIFHNINTISDYENMINSILTNKEGKL